MGETGFKFYWGDRATMMRHRRAMSFEQGGLLGYGFLLMGIAVVILYVVRANNDLYVLVFAILVVIEWLRVVAVALWRRKRWAWIIGLGFVPVILFQVWERFYDLGLVAKPWEGTPFDPNYIMALSLSISMAAYCNFKPSLVQ